MLFLSLALCKNLFVFFDGTWNNDKTNTNIYKMFDSFDGKAEANPYTGTSGVTSFIKNHNGDKAIYLYGLGTTSNKLLNKIQGLTGYGIEGWVEVGYQFLVQHLEDGDDLRVFGFSRGSTTARLLCNYLNLYGINHRNLRHSRLQKSLLDPAVKSLSGWIPKITFLGLFDSVVAVSTVDDTLGTLIRHINLKKRGFISNFWNNAKDKIRNVKSDVQDNLNTIALAFKSGKLVHMSDALGSNVLKCSHAVAINEYRSMFNFSSIDLKNPNFTQSYFMGAHSDIGGGGWVTSERSSIALQWILDQGELEKFFPNILPLDYNVEASGLDYPISDSYTEPMGSFDADTSIEKKLLPVFYRSFGMYDSLVHRSVREVASYMKVNVEDIIDRNVISPFLRLKADYLSGKSSSENFSRDLKAILS